MKFNKVFGVLLTALMLTSCGQGKTLTIDDGIAHLDAIQDKLKDYKDPFDSLHQAEISTTDNGFDIQQLTSAVDLDVKNWYFSDVVEHKITHIKDGKEELDYTYMYSWIDIKTNTLGVAFETNQDGGEKSYGLVPCKDFETAKNVFLDGINPKGIKAEQTKKQIPEIRKQLLTFKDMLAMAQEEKVEKLPTIDISSKNESHLYFKTFYDMTDSEGYYSMLSYECEINDYVLNKTLIETESGGVKASSLLEINTNANPKHANIDDTWSEMK